MEPKRSAAGFGGFRFESISPEMRALREFLSGPLGPKQLAETLAWIAREAGIDPEDFTEQQLLGLDLEALASIHAAASAPDSGSGGLLAELLLGAASLVSTDRTTWRGQLPELVTALSELIDLLPRRWGELCARAIPQAEDLLGVGQVEGAHFLLDGYEVFEPIGHGGMGQVRRAREHESGRWVAIKFLSSAFQSEEILKRFDREARLLDSLEHEGIARYLGQGVLNSMGSQVPYLVMEFLQGESLRAHAQRAGLSERERLQLFIPLCAAMEYAHSKGVIHRDLHPGNILVAPSGQPKILDFGIARSIDDRDKALTQTGQVLGVAAYLSPEQASGQAQHADVRMDVYSLGAILFELLSGETPHALGGLNLRRAWSAVASSEARHLRQVMPSADRRLEGILARALAFDPADRYATVHAFVGDLQAYLNNEELKATELNLAHLFRHLMRRYRGRVALAVLGVSFILVLILSAFWSRQQALDVMRENQRRSAELAQHSLEAIEFLSESWEYQGPRRHVLDSIVAVRALVRDLEAESFPQLASLQAGMGKLEGEWAFRRRDFGRAFERFALAEAILAKHLKRGLGRPREQALRSILLVRIGDTAKAQGQRSVAFGYYERALALDRRLAQQAAAPQDPRLQDNYCWSLLRRIDRYLELEQYSPAQGLLPEALQEVRRLVAMDLDRAHSQYAYARVLLRVIRIRAALGVPDAELIDLGEQAWHAARRATELDPGRLAFEAGHREALRVMGGLLAELDPERSRQLLEDERHSRLLQEKQKPVAPPMPN